MYMVVLHEISLLNTYYYLMPFEVPSNLDMPYKTICPNIFKNMKKVSPDPKTVYNTDFYLYNIKCAPIKSSIYIPIHQILLVQNDEMIDSLFSKKLDEWLDIYMYTPFMVTNPCYMIRNHTKRFFFSNKYACSLSIFRRENYVVSSIGNDGYSIGNGLTIALSMVSLGYWKEKALLHYISNKDICHKHTWANYTLRNSIYIMNHPFIYARQFNTSRTYSHIYDKYKVTPVICHMSPYYTGIYVTCALTDIRTVHQYDYMKSCIDLYQYYKNIITILNNVTVHIHINFTQIIKNILDSKQLYSFFLHDDILLENIKKLISLNKDDSYRTIMETFIYYEKIYPQKKFYKVYFKFSKAFPEELLRELYRCLVHIGIGDMRLPYPSEKFIRKTIYHNPSFSYFNEFSFTTYTYSNWGIPSEFTVTGTHYKHVSLHNASWKKLLKLLKYKDVSLKIMYRKLMILKRILSQHTQSHVLYFLVKEYIRCNPHILI